MRGGFAFLFLVLLSQVDAEGILSVCGFGKDLVSVEIDTFPCCVNRTPPALEWRLHTPPPSSVPRQCGTCSGCNPLGPVRCCGYRRADAGFVQMCVAGKAACNLTIAVNDPAVKDSTLPANLTSDEECAKPGISVNTTVDVSFQRPSDAYRCRQQGYCECVDLAAGGTMFYTTFVSRGLGLVIVPLLVLFYCVGKSLSSPACEQPTTAGLCAATRTVRLPPWN